MSRETPRRESFPQSQIPALLNCFLKGTDKQLRPIPNSKLLTAHTPFRCLPESSAIHTDTTLKRTTIRGKLHFKLVRLPKLFTSNWEIS